jgi:hypothetical protein
MSDNLPARRRWWQYLRVWAALTLLLLLAGLWLWQAVRWDLARLDHWAQQRGYVAAKEMTHVDEQRPALWQRVHDAVAMLKAALARSSATAGTTIHDDMESSWTSLSVAVRELSIIPADHVVDYRSVYGFGHRRQELAALMNVIQETLDD